MDASTSEGDLVPREMLISGAKVTTADGATKLLTCKGGHIFFGCIFLTLNQDGSLSLNDPTGCSARYQKVAPEAPDVASDLQGHWQPSELQSRHTSRLVIQGITWRFTGPAASCRTQGFVIHGKQSGTTFIGGCKASGMPDGSLSIALHGGSNLLYVRDVEATATLFARRLGHSMQSTRGRGSSALTW